MNNPNDVARDDALQPNLIVRLRPKPDQARLGYFDVDGADSRGAKFRPNLGRGIRPARSIVAPD